ncbi:uncharacterized protein LOC143473283 isoform X2 [Brachyhypopomus gauderio]|uniref:uncharacterized protein LOC143473283 isoform X2 n=1 Tax=Brachyhypopomus gauderio TaxID=698409 RepID=UPI004042E7CC
MPKIHPATKALIIKMLKTKSTAEVASTFNVSQRQVQRIKKRFEETGDVFDKPRSGRPHKTTAWEERLLVRKSKASPFSTAAELHQAWSPQVPVSTRTVCRILSRNGCLHSQNCPEASIKQKVNPQPETEGVTFAGTFANVKLESSPPSLAPHEVQPSERGLLQGQMFLVKAENQQNSNEPKVVHQTNCASCLEKHPRRTDGTPSGSSAVTKAASKQCIFYPVKEEESEILVEPPLSEKVTTVPEEQTECISQVILAPELPRPFTISLPEFRHGV